MLDVILHDGLGENPGTCPWSKALCSHIQAMGANAHPFAWFNDSFPIAAAADVLAIVGYSFGGAMAVHLCEELQKIAPSVKVRQLILLDAVPWGVENLILPLDDGQDWVIPANVMDTLCIKRHGASTLAYPWSRQTKAALGGTFRNVQFEASHSGIPDHADVQELIVKTLRLIA